MTHWVKTGRTDSRRRCESCNARIKVGEPQPTATWPERLRLTTEQTDLLLVAAADYRDLSIEAGEADDAVSFVDWVAGVLRQSGVRVTVDGAPSRNVSGGEATRDTEYTHRHPDPIPYAVLPRTWQR